MSRIIHGWNDIPSDYIQEEDFHLAPMWLRILARIKFIEKFAYPLAVKKGLVRRWKIKPTPGEPEFFWAEGIKYINSKYPGFNYESPIQFEMKKTKLYFPFFLLRIYSFCLLLKSLFATLFSGIFATRWGRNKKTEYMKSKISTFRS